MLGIILIYWIGKYYYKLAERFDKSKWGFAIVGIATYYGVAIGVGIMIGIVMELLNPGFFDTFNETLFSLLMVPFGLLGCYLLYKFLEKKWKRDYVEPFDLIEDIGKIEEPSSPI